MVIAFAVPARSFAAQPAVRQAEQPVLPYIAVTLSQSLWARVVLCSHTKRTECCIEGKDK